MAACLSMALASICRCCKSYKSTSVLSGYVERTVNCTSIRDFKVVAGHSSYPDSEM